MKKYNEFVSVIEKRLGKNTTTDNAELYRVGRDVVRRSSLRAFMRAMVFLL